MEIILSCVVYTNSVALKSAEFAYKSSCAASMLEGGKVQEKNGDRWSQNVYEGIRHFAVVLNLRSLCTQIFFIQA